MRYACFVVVALLSVGCAPHLPNAPTPEPGPTAGLASKVQLSVSPGFGTAGGTATVSALVSDAFATPVVGAAVAFTTASGTIESPIVTNDKGIAATTLQGPAGAVMITARVGTLEASTLAALQTVSAPAPAPTPGPPAPPAPTTGPLTVSVTTTGSTVGAPTIARALVGNPSGAFSMTWSFGDGASATSLSTSTGHTYAAIGTYRLTATVRDDGGRTASAGTDVTIGNAPIPAPPPTPVPVLSVTLTPAAGSVAQGGTLAFTATVANAGTDPVVAYEWNLDGTGAAEFTSTTNTKMSGVYPTPGIVTASVKVTTASGLTATGTAQIVVTN